MIKQNPHPFPINLRKSKMHEKMWEDPSEVEIWGSGTHLERSWRSAGSTVRWDAGRWQVVSCYSEGATTNQTFQACHFAKSELPGLWKDRGPGAVSSQEGQARKGGLNFELRCQEPMQHHDLEQKCSCFGAIVLSTNEIWRWETGCSLSSTARNGTKQSALTTQRAIHIQIIQII